MSNQQPDHRPPLIPQNLRIEYARGHLTEADALPDPVAQFERWFGEAQAANIPEPNAMTLATADATGSPSARVLLLKGFDERGFAFFTNYTSRKAGDLAANPRAALCFYWQPLERQVRIEGAVEKVNREESAAYFRTRPPSAQVAAWVSRQSRPITSRADLERREQKLLERFAGREVPLPDFWGGYRLVPHAVEFWQGRPSRLHDRIRYMRAPVAPGTSAPGGGWQRQRLSP